MKKKLFYLSLVLFFFLFFYTILLSSNCKSFSTVQKLNFSLLKICFNSVSISENIKNILSTNKVLFDFAKNFKRKNLPDFGKKKDLNQGNLLSNENADQIYFEKNYDIKGIINNPKELERLSIKNTQKIKFKTWFRSHGNNFNNKYIETININKNNLKDLKLISKIDTIENLNLKNKWKSKIGINPIYADGKIFFVTASWELVAVSADNYSILWSRDFKQRISKRGFLFHKNINKNQNFILISAGENLYKINPNNGKLIKNFGNSGFVKVGIVLIPPVIFENQIIVTSLSSRKILILDLINGSKIFSKSIHKKTKFYFMGNPWSGAALDHKNGIYFVVTGNPGGVIGVDRPGENKNSCSIIAFDLVNKKILWTFQDVIHDLWDFDLSAPPIIADLKVKNYIIPVVIVTTKTGNTYVLERKSGKSLFDINYRNAPRSNIQDEYTSPKQPEPVKPKKFSRIEFKKNDLREKFINDKEFMKNFEKNNTYGWFVPPHLGKDIVFYGVKGGNNWVGAAYNPVSQNLYIPANHIPYKIKILANSIEKEGENSNLESYDIYQSKCSSCHGVSRNGKWKIIPKFDITEKFVPSLVGISLLDSLKHKNVNYTKFLELHKKKVKLSKKEYNKIKELFVEWDENLNKDKKIYLKGNFTEYFADDGMLITKPPWGTITSIQLSDGSTNWQVPFGYENEKNIGLFNMGGVSVTSTNLLVATGATDKMLTILDAENGNTLWKYQMSSEGSAAPLIFNHNNKTFIAVIATGGLYPQSTKASSLYIFGISN